MAGKAAKIIVSERQQVLLQEFSSRGPSARVSHSQGLAASGSRTLARDSTAHHQIVVDPNGFLGSYDTTANSFRSSGYNVSSLGSGWHHIAAVGTGSTTTFYIDGVAVGRSISFKSTSEIAALGNNTLGGQRFASLLDEIRIYDRAHVFAVARNERSSKPRRGGLCPATRPTEQGQRL